MRKKFLVKYLLPVILGSLLLFGCKGSDGTSGTSGADGVVGTTEQQKGSEYDWEKIFNQKLFSHGYSP